MGRSRGVETKPNEITKERAEELGRCYNSYVYFIHNYCYILDSVEKNWIPFHLWPDQERVLHDIHKNKLTVILKARQLGISWLCLGYALWNHIFRPVSITSIFSRREQEAAYLLGEERLRGMYNYLPVWMKTGNRVNADSVLEWSLTNGSVVRAFSTNSGDGYVATLAIIDEADLSPDLGTLMRSVKPTIDGGGKMILLSRSNKSEPESDFKLIYKGAKVGDNPWHSVFLPWTSHPSRNQEWYATQKREIISRTGSLDELWEQYPETDSQALSAATLDKRIPPMWLEACYEQGKEIRVKGSPSLTGLQIYKGPKVGCRYVLGADPAEGNPTSDDSSISVVDMEVGEEVATFTGKIEPAVFAHYIALVSTFYNNAPAMVERNNHGHSVIQWLDEHARRVRLLLGHDIDPNVKTSRQRKQRRIKYGWLSSTTGKAILYTTVTEHIRTCANFDDEDSPAVPVIHHPLTMSQLGSIEAASLRAPEKQHDDKADSYALAIVGRQQIRKRGEGAVVLVLAGKGWGY